MSWLQIKKKKSFWNIIFSYSMQQQWWTISWLGCNVRWKVDFIWQPVMTSSVVGLRRSSNALLKANLAPKKGHGHCLVVCCLSNPLHLSESQWNITSERYAQWINESMRYTENCIACSQHWSTERAQIFSITMPNCMSLNQCFRSRTNWAMKFCLIRHIHLISHQSTRPSLLQALQQLSAGKMLPQPAGGRKYFPKVYWILQQVFLYYRNKQTWQKCAEYNGSYFD